MYNTKIFSFLLITSGLLVASENSSQASETKTITLSYQAKKIIEMSENFNPDQIDTLITFLENKNSEEMNFRLERLKLQKMIANEEIHGIGFGQDWKEEQYEQERRKTPSFPNSPYLRNNNTIR